MELLLLRVQLLYLLHSSHKLCSARIERRVLNEAEEHITQADAQLLHGAGRPAPVKQISLAVD